MHLGFVDIGAILPQVQTEIRYATSHNLTGHPLAGYHRAAAIMTEEAAQALTIASEAAASMGYGLLIYDAYRPQKAVQDFVSWSKQPEDGTTKPEFYPEL